MEGSRVAERKLFDYEGFKAGILKEVTQKLGERYKVYLKKISRNNSIWFDGLIVVDRIVKCASPGIYINTLYEEYLAGRDMQSIVKELVECILNFSSKADYADISCDYDKVRDKIICRLVNYELNRKGLENIPHVEFLDFAVTFHIMVSSRDKHIETMQVTNKIFETFGITIDELYAIALVNTERLMPPYICPIHEILMRLVPDMVRTECEEDTRPDMYVLSNRYGIGGAACMLYPNIMQFIDNYDIGSCIILPSSVHEVILLKDAELSDTAILKEMVKEVNDTQVPPDEILSGNLYYYSSEEKRIFRI